MPIVKLWRRLGPIDGIDLVTVDVPEEADFVFLAGLDDDTRIADLSPLLTRWRALDLGMVCSNPDSHGVTEFPVKNPQAVDLSNVGETSK